MRIILLSVACAAAILAGCDFTVNFDSKKANSNTPPTSTETVNETQQPVETERVIAKGGVGKEGQSLRGDDVNQTISQPARVLFDFKQDAKFLVVQHTLNAYEAYNGKVPQTHEAFMKEIIEEHNITLPELPEGHKYVWDPKEKKLFVERPVKR